MSGTFRGDGGFKGGDVRAELGEKTGIQSNADELCAEGGGIRLKGARGIEQGLVAIAVRHEKFSRESGVAEQDERMRGVGDGDHVIVQMHAANGFGQDAAVRLFRAGDLSRTERAGGGHGGGDDGELLSAEAGRREIGGVFDAKGGNGFEGRKETRGFLVHDIKKFMIP